MERTDFLKKELAKIKNKIKLVENKMHQTGYDVSDEEIYADDIYKREAKIQNNEHIDLSKFTKKELKEKYEWLTSQLMGKKIEVIENLFSKNKDKKEAVGNLILEEQEELFPENETGRNFVLLNKVSGLNDFLEEFHTEDQFRKGLDVKKALTNKFNVLIKKNPKLKKELRQKKDEELKKALQRKKELARKIRVGIIFDENWADSFSSIKGFKTNNKDYETLKEVGFLLFK